MTIKHIVIPSGGARGFHFYGALKYLNQCKFWRFKNIKTIYGTSIGGLMAILISFGIKWEELDEFIINTNLEDLVNIDASSLLSLFQSKGLILNKIVDDIFNVFLKKLDLSKTLTLKQHYDKTKIEVHMYTVNINLDPLKLVDLSYKTHPNLTISNAIKMTIAIPFIIEPVIYKGGCYIDGALFEYKPVKQCLTQTNCKHNEILIVEQDDEWLRKINKIDKETNVFDYSISFIQNLLCYVSNDNYKIPDSIPYRVKIVYEKPLHIIWVEGFKNKNGRKEFIKQGEEMGRLFKLYLKKTI
jgi:predicted acylesterase/phospholipase RssA